MHGIPIDLTFVIAGDHIDCIMTSPDAIRLTDSSNVFQNALNCPFFFASVKIAIVLSISSLVILPLSPYFTSPMASQTIAASIIPIDAMFNIEALPLNSGLSSSVQLSIGRPIMSGRIPKVSAL